MAAYSYGDYSIRESLWDQIKDIEELETYVTSHSAKVKVANKVHSWVIDPVSAMAAQAGTVEMADTSYSNTVPTLLNNTTQIIEYGIAVATTNLKSDHAGFTDKWAREQLKAMKNWKNQLEFSAVAGSLVSGTGSAARTMKGIAGFASTLATTCGSGVSLLSSMLNAYLMNALGEGAQHDTLLVGPALKTRISMFSENNTRNIPATEAMLVGRVDVYDSDGGRVKVIYHRYVNSISGAVTNALVSYASDYIQVGFLDEPHYEDRAQTGYFKSGAIVGEATVQVDNELAVQCVKLLK